MDPIEGAPTPEPQAFPEAIAAPPAPREEHPLHPMPEAARPLTTHPRPPIHAVAIYARASRLALFQDPLHAWVVPFLLLLPYTLLDAFLPEPKEIFGDMGLLALYAVGGILGLITTLIVASMLRVRAAVHSSGGHVHGLDAYARSVERLPVLLLTEIVRSLTVAAAAIAFLVPGVVLGQRLSVATEYVVLEEPIMGAGFQRSFERTRGRFGAWVRMILLTLVAAVVALVGASIVYGIATATGHEFVANLAVAPFASMCLAVVQYAWTFYFLELGGRAVGAPFPDPSRLPFDAMPPTAANP